MKVEDQYMQVVCDELKISAEEIKSKSRKREICEARQMTSFLIKKYTKMSFWRIADMLNYVSHASPMRDVKQVNILFEVDKTYAKKMLPVIRNASKLARQMRQIEEQKKKQEEYDRIFADLTGDKWYSSVFYCESLMLPV